MTAPRSTSTIDAVVSWVLRTGVVASVALVSTGIAWHWIATGETRLHYTLTGTNVLGFAIDDIHAVFGDGFRPRALVNLGIAVLMLTPYVRVLASLVYFAAERDWKYTVFTAFVFATLTYGVAFG
jgi:uncharacterized membrane protein